ncbi:12145_t:CDS:2, partial [Racocetra persica]
KNLGKTKSSCIEVIALIQARLASVKLINTTSPTTISKAVTNDESIEKAITNNERIKKAIINDERIEKADNGNDDKYLKVELLDEGECEDVRIFRKRKRKNDTIEVIEPLAKKGKVQELKPINEKINLCENMMYIPFAELSDDLDLLKNADDQNIKIQIVQGVFQDEKSKSSEVVLV